MKLINLDIQRMPGFQQEGLTYSGLGSGVHVIWGPNGSGKSTTCRALKALLWPSEEQLLHPVLLHSEWEWEKERQLIHREGSSCSIPEPIQRSLNKLASHPYFFALDDLFNDKHKDLAQLVASEMHGGHDLSVLWKNLEITTYFGRNEAIHLSNCRRELDQIYKIQSKVVDLEEGIEQLKKEIDLADRAKRELAQVDCALECVRLKKMIEEIPFDLNQGKKLDGLFLELRQAEIKLQEKQEEILLLRLMLEELGFQEGGIVEEKQLLGLSKLFSSIIQAHKFKDRLLGCVLLIVAAIFCFFSFQVKEIRLLFAAGCLLALFASFFLHRNLFFKRMQMHFVREIKTLSLNDHLEKLEKAKEFSESLLRAEMQYKRLLEQKQQNQEVFIQHLPEFLRQKQIHLAIEIVSQEIARKTHLEGRLEQKTLDLEELTLLTFSREELEEKKSHLLVCSSKLESLIKEKADIEKDVGEELSLEKFREAEKKIQKANEAFEKKRIDAKKILLSRAFLKHVEERFEKEGRPKVLAKASEYFETFSLGAYSLRNVAHEKLGLRIKIFDNKRQKEVYLEHLSRGLQIQLLLSVRLGYLCFHEQTEVRVPLFLDEVLCHIDDERFGFVIDALTEIAKQRQVFLFTCQRASLRLWEEKGARLINLQDGRQIKPIPPDLKFEEFCLRKPELGKTGIEYALDLGLACPKRGWGLFEQPSWILLDSAKEIFLSLECKITTIGHLLAFIRLHPKVFTDTLLIEEKSLLVKKALALIEIGQPKTVCRSDLEKAIELQIFSHTFLDAVDECAKKVQGNAEELLSSIKEGKIKRFPSKYIEPLEKYFVEEKFLDFRKPLSEEDLRYQLYGSSKFSSEHIQFINNFLSLLRL